MLLIASSPHLDDITTCHVERQRDILEVVGAGGKCTLNLYSPRSFVDSHSGYDYEAIYVNLLRAVNHRHVLPTGV